MRIKEAEEQLNIDRATIRFYEKEGLFVTWKNPLNGYRDYSEDNIETLKKIIFLRDLDVAIEDIKKMQEHEVTLAEVVGKQMENSKARQQKLTVIEEVLDEMSKDSELTYNNLNAAVYRIGSDETDAQEQERKKLFMQTMKNIYIMKDLLIPWILILVSLFVSVAVYPLLPERIGIDWTLAEGVTGVGRGRIFIFPFLLFFITITVKSLVLNILYQHFAFLLHLTDEIAEHAGVCIAFMIITYQMIVVLFAGGIRLPLWPVMAAEALVSILIIWGLHHSKSQRALRRKG